MIAGEPRDIIADRTTSPAQIAYELGYMFKLRKSSAEASGELAVFAIDKVEDTIAFAIVAGERPAVRRCPCFSRCPASTGYTAYAGNDPLGIGVGMPDLERDAVPEGHRSS